MAIARKTPPKYRRRACLKRKWHLHDSHYALHPLDYAHEKKKSDGRLRPGVQKLLFTAC